MSSHLYSTVVALLLIRGSVGTAQTILTTNVVKLENRLTAPPAATRSHFGDRGDVRLESFSTNRVALEADRLVLGVVRNRWRQLLDLRSEPPAATSVILEFRLYSDGRVAGVQPLGEPTDKVFALMARKAIEDPAPYQGLGGRNESRIVRLRFSFQERPR